MAEAAIGPEPLLSPGSALFPLLTECAGESPITPLVAVLGVVARLADDLGRDAVQGVLDRARADALRLGV